MCDLYTADDMMALFSGGREDSADRCRAVAHAAVCEDCRRALARGAGWEVPPGPLADPRAVVEMAQEAAGRLRTERQRERQEAESYLAVLDPKGLPAVILRLRSRREQWTAGMVELVLERARSYRCSDPTSAFAYADVAVNAAASLEVPDANDLRARAWAELGNGWRLLERLGDADEAFGRMHGYLSAGSGSEVLRAEMLSLEASLRIDQGRFSEAIEMLEIAGRSADRLGEGGRLRLRLKRGIALLHSGEVETAQGVLVRALHEAAAQSEKGLAVVACHDLLWCLGESALALADDAERRLLIDELLTTLERARPLYRLLPTHELELDWLRGRLLAGRGELTQAEEELKQALQRLLSFGCSLNSAIVALDIATIYLSRSASAELSRLVTTCLEVFASAELVPEFWAVVRLLGQERAREATENLLPKAVRKLGGLPFRFKTASIGDSKGRSGNR